jgi:hypothetical protein
VVVPAVVVPAVAMPAVVRVAAAASRYGRAIFFMIEVGRKPVGIPAALTS